MQDLVKGSSDKCPLKADHLRAAGVCIPRKILKWDQQVIFSWHIQFKVFVKKLQVFSGFHFSLGGSAEPPEQPKKFTTNLNAMVCN